MENIYLKEHIKKDCNGCKVCAMVCPVNAIEMIEDNEGFEYPQIDESKCINCGKCHNTCSNFNDTTTNSNVYMAINKNKEELQKSSSGGMFIVFANYVINKGGVVFGVELTSELKTIHSYAETIEECQKYHGSKYVRSDVNNSYEQVKKFLEEDRYVLFTGTPCQCNALKVYLKKDYDKLLLCDIICHASPSPKVFEMYIKELEKTRNKKVKTILFRDKSTGWRKQKPIIVYEDDTKEEEGSYFNAFVNELIDRPSCYDCKFCGTNRVTDFSIGDFWGIEKILPEVKDDDTGISLLSVNTQKGKNIFDEINKNLEYKEVLVEEGFRYNHSENEKMHKNRKKFFRRLKRMSVIKNLKKCIDETFFEKCFIKSRLILKSILKRFKKSK